MKFALKLLAAAVLSASPIGAGSAVAQQQHIDTDPPARMVPAPRYVRHHYAPRSWHRRCRFVWRHHHRVRVCRR